MFFHKRTVFISHSTKNAEIADQLSGLLQKIGISSDNIFCSSVLGQGVNNGEKLNDKIYTSIKRSDIIVYLLSDAFINSSYCMEELGIGWFFAFHSRKTCFYIRIPDIEMDELKGFVNSKIDKFSLVDSRDDIALFVENVCDNMRIKCQKTSVVSNYISTFISAISALCQRAVDAKSLLKSNMIKSANEVNRLNKIITEKENVIESYKYALEIKESEAGINDLRNELRHIVNLFDILGMSNPVSREVILNRKQFFFNMINRYEELLSILNTEPSDGHMEKLLAQAYLACNNYDKAYLHFLYSAKLREYMTEREIEFFVEEYPYSLNEVIQLYEIKLNNTKEGLVKDFIRDTLAYMKLKEKEKGKKTAMISKQ